MLVSVLLDMCSKAGIDFFTGVPDSLLKGLCNELYDRYGTENDIHTVAHNEGGAIALCAAHYLATGKAGLCYILVLPEPHKPAAAGFRKLREAHRLVERDGFRRVVRDQPELADVRVPVEHGLQQRLPDALPLFLREYQDVLDMHDRAAVADGPEDPEQFAVFPGGQRQQGMREPLPQRFHIFRIGGPADR